MKEGFSVACYVTDILLVDVVGFAKLTTLQQHATAVIMTNKLQEMTRILVGQAFRELHEVVLGSIPTGDGFYVLLHHEIAGYGVLLAISLRSALLLASKQADNLFTGVRMSVHLGEAIPFTDITGRKNYVGDGLNVCARLLKAKPSQSPDAGIPQDDNYIVVSETAHAWFEKSYPRDEKMQDFLKAIHYKKGGLFEIRDKHGATHKAHFIECSRYVAIKPPPPADIKERLKRLVESSKSRAPPQV